jgi:hypothetical protein
LDLSFLILNQSPNSLLAAVENPFHIIRVTLPEISFNFPDLRIDIFPYHSVHTARIWCSEAFKLDEIFPLSLCEICYPFTEPWLFAGEDFDLSYA